MVTREQYAANRDPMIAIVIPALNPDAALPGYCRDLRAITDAPIVLVDDGSRAELAHIFDDCAAAASGVTVLRHEVNRGKGRGLKTAFDDRLTVANIYRWYQGKNGNYLYAGDGAFSPSSAGQEAEALAMMKGFYNNCLVAAVTDGVLTFGWRKTDKDNKEFYWIPTKKLELLIKLAEEINAAALA